MKSVIGYGSPKAGSEKAHGEPLGEDAIRATKKAYGWPEDAKFPVPDGVREAFRGAIETRGKPLRDEWVAMVERYRAEYPELAAQLDAMLSDTLPEGWDSEIPVFEADAKGWPAATRAARCRTPSPPRCRGWSAVRPISRPRPRR